MTIVSLYAFQLKDHYKKVVILFNIPVTTMSLLFTLLQASTVIALHLKHHGHPLHFLFYIDSSVTWLGKVTFLYMPLFFVVIGQNLFHSLILNGFILFFKINMSIRNTMITFALWIKTYCINKLDEISIY